VQADAVRLGRLFRLVARIALIHVDQFHVLSRGFWHGGQFAGLCSILLIGRRHQQSQQMPRGIGGEMDFAALAPFGSITASAMPTFRTRLQRPTIKVSFPHQIGGSSPATHGSL